MDLHDHADLGLPEPDGVFVLSVCPWCLLVTLSTTLVFTSLTHVNIRDGNLFLPERVNDRLRAGLRMGLDALIVTGWLAIVIGSIFVTYGALLFA